MCAQPALSTPRRFSLAKLQHHVAEADVGADDAAEEAEREDQGVPRQAVAKPEEKKLER